MQKITCWDDLRPYGIAILTGEACGLSYRILCDVTERGKQTIQKALGITSLGLPDNWNHGDPNDPPIGSYAATFVMWHCPGSSRRFADGGGAGRHIFGNESVVER